MDKQISDFISANRWRIADNITTEDSVLCKGGVLHTETGYKTKKYGIALVSNYNNSQKYEVEHTDTYVVWVHKPTHIRQVPEDDTLVDCFEIAMQCLLENDYIICNDNNHKELLLDVIQARKNTETAIAKIKAKLRGKDSDNV